MPYRLSALAERDLEEIWSYVAEDASPATADRLIDAIIDRFELLAEQPRMGRLRPEFGEGVRSFAVENYVIYYRHEGDVLGSQGSAWPSRPDRRVVGTRGELRVSRVFEAFISGAAVQRASAASPSPGTHG